MTDHISHTPNTHQHPGADWCGKGDNAGEHPCASHSGPKAHYENDSFEGIGLSNQAKNDESNKYQCAGHNPDPHYFHITKPFDKYCPRKDHGEHHTDTPEHGQTSGVTYWHI